jgi:hypothetical protein
MKKIIVTTLATVAVGLSVFAQGTVNFANGATGLNAQDFLSDGTTPITSAYTAVLFAGPTAGSLAQIASVSYAASPAGYFFGGSQTIGSIGAGGTAFIQIYAFLTADTSLATAMTDGGTLANQWGSSSVFSVTTGNPTTTPAGLPATLIGLTSFNLNSVVPEPATLALMGLGGASLLLFRRRKV